MTPHDIDKLTPNHAQQLAHQLATHIKGMLTTDNRTALPHQLHEQDEQDEQDGHTTHITAEKAQTLLEKTKLVHALLTSRHSPPSLIDAAAPLHDLIFDLTDPATSALQSAIVELCLAFWHLEKPGRDELVPQTISFLLVAALHEGATPDDVKRLCAMRGALSILDYSDDSIAPLKRLLLHCAIKPLLLRSADGRRFLIHLFSLHPPLIAELHLAIKGQLPECSRSMRERYGEVYFKAWRSATGPYLDRLEEACLQDLMFHAVHASSTKMLTVLRQVLSFVHAQKRQRGVDEMLQRLYGPFLWRSLSAANPNVRRNAATIFIDAFPLQDPGLPLVELDALLQRQFDALGALLKDAAVSVRIVGVHGVFRVLALYWELIPPPTSAALLATLTQQLAYDASASTVRAAVVEGLKFLVAQATSESCIAALRGGAKSPLAAIAPLINDSSQRVRAATLDLLIELSKVRGFSWQSVVKVDVLVTRLPLEPASLQQRLTRLLLPLHLPAATVPSSAKDAKAAAATLERTLALCTSRPAAAIAMLRHAPNFASADAVVRLASLLMGAVISDAAPDELARVIAPDELPPPSDDTASSGPAAESTERLTKLTACAAALLDAAPPSSLASSRAALLRAFSRDAMERAHERAHGSALSAHCLLRIGAHLPADHVPQAMDCVREIAGQPADASPWHVLPLLQCALSWEQEEPVLNSLLVSLGVSDEASAGAKRGRASRGRPARDASAKSNRAQCVEMPTQLALRVLWCALEAPSTRDALVTRKPETLRQLLAVLRSALDAATAAAAERRAGIAVPASDARDAMLTLSCFLQLSWHVNAAADGSCAAAAVVPACPARESLQVAMATTEAIFGTGLVADEEAASAGGAKSGEAPWPLAAASPGLTPGELRPRTRSRIQHPADDDAEQMGAAVKCDKNRAPSASHGTAAAAHLLVCAWIAEGCSLGTVDETLAAQACAFARRGLLAASADGVDAHCQLLPHACKLTLQLLEVGRECAPHGEQLLVDCLTSSGALLDSSARGTMRTVVLEALALTQHRRDDAANLMHRLLCYTLGSIPAEAPDADEMGVDKQALRLPPVASQTIELMLRSSACDAVLLPSMAAIVDATHESLRDALTAVRLLLTFEGLHAASRPGAAALRLSVRRLLDAVQVAPPESAPPRLARLCGVLLQALG